VTVSILMAVRNGAAHLPAQLASFAAQTHRDWRLVASDDGSTDHSRAVLADFAAAAGSGRVTVAAGPGRGAAANFLALLAGLPEVPGWAAFSDQDDVWLPERLEMGLAALAGETGAALYCSRTWVTDPDLGRRRLSAPRPRPPSFANALVQNIAAGNTMLLNPAGAALLRAAAAEAGAVVVHDWWAYQVMTGAGGRVVHDDRPTLLYRQHGANTIGVNDGWRAQLRRLGQIADGTFAGWNRTNLDALSASAHRFTPEARALLGGFATVRQTPGPLARLRGLRRLGLYRQTAVQDAGLWLTALAGRL
jgi:hypothetical protein